MVLASGTLSTMRSAVPATVTSVASAGVAAASARTPARGQTRAATRSRLMVMQEQSAVAPAWIQSGPASYRAAPKAATLPGSKSERPGRDWVPDHLHDRDPRHLRRLRASARRFAHGRVG